MKTVRKTSRFLIFLLICFILASCNRFLPEEPIQPSEPSVPGKPSGSNEPNEDSTIKQLVRSLSLEEKIGQMLMPAFRQWKGEDVTSINEDIKEMVGKYHLGGVILFRENIVNEAQIRKLIADLQESAQIPMFISVDQEGGIINRIRFIPEMPGNMALGATRNPDLAEKTGYAIGQHLKALGFNMDMAPVLDVNNNPDNPVIGIRSFGEDPELVAEMGIAFANGLKEAGIIPVGKHFPGHGDTSSDSHYVLPVQSHNLKRLNQIELVPFRAWAKQGLPALMTAHITFPAIDATEVKSKKDGMPISLPATLSEKVLEGLARKELHYEGILMTDAMNMGAIADHFGTVDAAIQAVKAGNDIILMPVGIDEVYHGLINAVKNGKISEERINESVERILRTKEEYGILHPRSENIEVVDSAAIEKLVAKESVTLVRNEGDVLPLSSDFNGRIVIMADSSVLSQLETSAKKRYTNIKSLEITKSKDGYKSITSAQKEVIKEADAILIATRTQFGMSKVNVPVQLIEYVLQLQKPSIAIALGSPYDLSYCSNVDAMLATYSDSLASIETAMDIIFGLHEAKGKLPVTLPDIQ